MPLWTNEPLHNPGFIELSDGGAHALVFDPAKGCAGEGGAYLCIDQEARGSVHSSTSPGGKTPSPHPGACRQYSVWDVGSRSVIFGFASTGVVDAVFASEDAVLCIRPSPAGGTQRLTLLALVDGSSMHVGGAGRGGAGGNGAVLDARPAAAACA